MDFPHLPAWLVAWTALVPTAAPAAGGRLEAVWQHDAGGPARAEIVAYDRTGEVLWVSSGDQRCVAQLDVQDGTPLGRLDVGRWGDPTSVAACGEWIAVAVAARPKTVPGHVLLFRAERRPRPAAAAAEPVAAVRVGCLPDMVTFTPDGRYVLVANEGEPSDDGRTDPQGSISVIDLGRGPGHAAVRTADFHRFNAERDALEQQGVRLAATGWRHGDARPAVAVDLEPEYIAVAPDSATAWVTLQENNALAEVDVRQAHVRRIIPLGWKDHRQQAAGLDASDRDGGVHIAPWPVWGMYQPDGIAAVDIDGETYLVTANEGDHREYGDTRDDRRVADLPIAEALLDEHPHLQQDDRLGRLKVSRLDGDTDGDGRVDRLLAFGGRSMSIWNAAGQQVYDSGDALERFVAEHLPARFNIDRKRSGRVDRRSPHKGPEPEGVVTGRVGATCYAFVGLERTSAIAVFDITRPAEAELLEVVPLGSGSEGRLRHVAPEGLAFIAADANPLGQPLLAVACEVSGTTILYRVRESR